MQKRIRIMTGFSIAKIGLCLYREILFRYGRGGEVLEVCTTGMPPIHSHTRFLESAILSPVSDEMKERIY